MESAKSELGTLGSMAVGAKQVARGVARSGSIVYEGVNAAVLANEISKAHKTVAGQSTGDASASGSSAAADGVGAGGLSEKQPAVDDTTRSSTSGVEDTKKESDQKSPQQHFTKEEEEKLQGKIEKISSHMFTVMYV